MRKTTMLVAVLLMPQSPAWAQVSIRAPFVRVDVNGGGVSVRAPYVRYYSGPPVAFAPPSGYIAPPVQYVPQYGPQTAFPGQIPMAIPAPIHSEPPLQTVPAAVVPNAQPKADFAPPPPVQAPQTMTLEKFSKSFQPRSGNYEFSLVNPVTQQPTEIRFTLPAGEPRIETGAAFVLYQYAGRQMVRIEFDKDGATVISR